MQNFRTVVVPARLPFQITHTDKIVSIGSCFSENIGKKLRDYKFSININPFGQQYNPHSVCTAIHRLINPVHYTEADLVFYDELYHSFQHHGSFSRGSKEETLSVINQNLMQASNDVKQATLLFLTFGTSHVFSLIESNEIVSNCHKLSGTLFNKRLLKPEEIVSDLQKAFAALQAFNPRIKIILTVSPVRYFAFGHHENTVSKAHLFSAIHTLQEQNPELHYFPAYELVMDDLRDYRFFSEDMLHPNYQATDYVWQKLCDAMMDKKTMAVMKDVEEISAAVSHRARNPNSSAHKKFLQKYLDKIESLAQQNFDFTDEKKRLSIALNQ